MQDFLLTRRLEFNMAKHHAITKTVSSPSGDEEIITDILSDALVPIPSGAKVIKINAPRAPDNVALKYDEGGVGLRVEKFKVTGTAPVYTKTTRTSSDIRSSLEWKEAHLDNLIKDTKKKIEDLGEDKIKSLSLRKSEGETLTSDQQDDIDDFINDMNTIKDTDFHDAAASEGYSRFKTNLTIGTGSRTVTLKKFPTGWVANDKITIVDRGKDAKEFEVTLTAVNATNKTITFEDPGHATDFKRLTSFAFKATV